jgi:TolB-like protein/tRNA A-37 threonylcarbamoyl transferase component Bud32
MSDQDQQDQPEQLERLRRALLGTYEIERQLGEGGMAIVYLAHDVKHDRQVAIKVLRPELAASLGHDRFLREIKIAAKLSHPHILPLYDSGEADGLLYYVMPFVEGESLADHMAREKQLPVEEAVQITREVAEALSVAHSSGLVHRDIKPENVMMTGGHAVVADFGIALAVDHAGGEKLTQTGMAVGTPAYMSPEQAQGEANIDGRADIYSLGCMMYEMLVGQIPFTAPTPMAMIARHTMDHPTPISIMRESISPDLENIVFVAMEKTPADRFRTAQHMVDALKGWEQGTATKVRQSAMMQRRATGMHGPAPTEKRRWKKLAVPAGAGALAVVAAVLVWQLGFAGGGVPPIDTGLDPTSVAVMYFADLSNDGSAAAVADGLTEELIAELSTVSGLNVISRNGVAQFRSSELRIDSIARVLETGSVVTGSVEPIRDTLRVNVRLVDGFTGSEVDRTSVELPAAGVLSLQDSVAELVSGFLRQRVGKEVRIRESRAGTNDDGAWMLVRRAEQLRDDAFQHEEEEPERARQLYLEADSLAALAADRDQRWAEPVTLRGWISYDLAYSEDSRQRVIERREEAVRLAAEAIARDPTYADAHHLRGRARFVLFLMEASPDEHEREQLLDSAQADLQAAVDRDPTLAEAWYALSNLDYARADNVSALIAAREAYEADRFMSNMDANLEQLFETHYDLEQFADADKWCMEGARRFPGDWRFVECQQAMLITPWADADVDRAWQLAAELDSLAPDELVRLRARMRVAGVLARANRPDSARAVIAATQADPGVDPDAQLANDEAFVHILLGQQAGDEASRLREQDEAIELLKRYNAANRGHGLEADRDLHWQWRPLRDNPRFREVTERGR